MKVVTSDGGIQSTEVIADKKRPVRESAAPLEIQKQPHVAEIGESSANSGIDNAKGVSKAGNGEAHGSTAEASAAGAQSDPNDGIDPEDIVELARAEAEKERKRVGKYVARLRAQEAIAQTKAQEAADSERFAEQLFNERELERKRAASLEQELQALKAKVAPPAAELKEPQPDEPKYKNDKGEFDWLKFSDDRADYKVKKALADDRQKQAEAQEQVRLEAARIKRAEKVAAAVKKNADWESVVTSSQVTLPQSVLDYIDLSDYGTDIAYFLAKNPEVAGKIRELHPIRAVAEVRDLELSLTKQPEKPTAPVGAPSQAAESKGAPAPITPIAASGANPPPLDPAKMNFQQLRAYERERARGRGRR